MGVNLKELERLLEGLTGLTGPRDAIDVELGAAPRTTSVVSLRESPEVEAFRNELVDGFIRADTANRLLRLINELITRARV
ncbi:MAG: hypothetical protein AMXMBFR13_48170 [Phycisphaerae bacterium]